MNDDPSASGFPTTAWTFIRAARTRSTPTSPGRQRVYHTLLATGLLLPAGPRIPSARGARHRLRLWREPASHREPIRLDARPGPLRLEQVQQWFVVLLRAEVRDHVDADADVGDEIRELMALLQR